jgi:hypothetical protein
MVESSYSFRHPSRRVRGDEPYVTPMRRTSARFVAAHSKRRAGKYLAYRRES